MFFNRGKRFILLSLFSLLFVCSQIALGQDKNWREVSPAELQMKTPQVEADADAEAIFWEVRVDDSTQDVALNHYVRVKIFTERGREKYSKIDVPFFKGMKVRDVAARVIKTDGSVVEINKSDVFEREIARANGIKVKAKSFAVPNIEPGVILEYRYREVIDDSGVGNMDLRFQRDIPIQKASYYVKPYAYGAQMRYFSFNMNDTKFVEDKKGFYVATMNNIPALKDETRMPPADEVRSWMLIYYNNYGWANLAGDRGRGFKTLTKSNSEIKKTAQEITASAQTDAEKISKVFQYVKTQIKNVSFDTSMTDEARFEINKKNKDAGDIFKNKQGVAADIDILFASMTTALGYETRVVLSGDRSEKFFQRQVENLRFIHPCCVAVKVGNSWNFYNPGAYLVPEGMLVWYEENTSAMLAGEKDFYWTETPLSDAKKSLAKRTGKFKLLEDGTLEGTVKLEYGGHLGYQYKISNYDKSANQREENLKEEIKKQMSTAEVSDISIENVSDPEKPFTYQYKVRVPNYAQKTGKRLFLQPGFFEYGREAEFSTAARKYDIYFNFPWSEDDSIEIELPKNFALDSADAPGDVGDPQQISSLNIKIAVDKAANTLKYDRKFYFGGGGNILFPSRSYQVLKTLFDNFHKADTHTITLRQN